MLTGASLVTMALVAGFAYGYLHPQVLAAVSSPGPSNQADILALFRMEILGWWLVVILDLVVSMGVYALFRSESRPLASAVMTARLGYTAVLVVAVLGLTAGGASGPDQAGLVRFETLWSLGLVVFGLHLVLLAIVTGNSGVAPKLLAGTLGLAGVCYLVVHGLRGFPGPPAQIAGALEPVLALPMAVGELWFALWLIHGFLKSGNRGADA